jgi:cell fate regulator YaaT (PSP1 superfamily)
VVAVEGSPGHDIGVVSLTGELVRFQMRKKNIKEISEDLKVIYRKARVADVEKWESAKAAEDPTMHRAREIALQLKLSMKLSDVEYQGDMKKATFFYTADDRVDFRELIKRLAEEFKTRIEMKQIGMRQEASRLGGIGSCGRELCCSTWLTDFRSVSTSAARYQNLSLNPLKLAGQCGKLKCCLNYELDAYLDAIKHFPDTGTVLVTKKGKAYHRKTDIFKQTMWYSYGYTSRDSGESDGADANNWVPLTIKRIKDIIELNKKNEFPEDLAATANYQLAELPGYKDVVGQDSLTRLDKKHKHKKKRRSPDQRQNRS